MLPAFYGGNFAADEMTGHLVFIRYKRKPNNIVVDRREPKRPPGNLGCMWKHMIIS